MRRLADTDSPSVSYLHLQSLPRTSLAADKAEGVFVARLSVPLSLAGEQTLPDA